MKALTDINLSEDFCNHYGIDTVHDSFSGGQKHVFIVSKGDVKIAVKVFKNYGKREIRELKIYEEFSHIDGIPKIDSIEEFQGDTIVFETFIEGYPLQDIRKEYEGKENSVKLLINSLCVILKPFWERVPTIIHRDIKPSNVIVRPNGHPVLIDFGIARDLGDESITHSGQPQPGTWCFAAPEQYSGDRKLISYRTDFFSLGVLAYYLYYNSFPFGSKAEDVAEKFKKNDMHYHTVGDCGLNDFFKGTLKVLPAERPRKPDELIKLLKI